MKQYDKPSLKVNCSFCNRDMECPEDMMDSKKHMCYECFKNPQQATQGRELQNVHVDIPRDKLDETVSEANESMSNILAEDLFPPIWKEDKEKLKQMSKKDLAQEMFKVGAHMGMKAVFEQMKDMDKEDDESDRQDINQHDFPAGG